MNIKLNFFLSNKSFSNNHSSTIIRGMFGLIHQNKDGLYKVYTNEHHFIYNIEQGNNPPEKVSLTLEQMETISRITIGKTIKKDYELLAPSDIGNHISCNGRIPNPLEKDLINGFLEPALELTSKIPVKPNLIPELIEGCRCIKGELEVKALKAQSALYNDTAIHENKYAVQAVDKIVDSMGRTSDRTIEFVDLLLRYTEVSEMLTFLASNQLLLKCLGVQLYLLVSGSLCMEGSFVTFFKEVREVLRSKISPTYHKVKMTCSFVYKNKYTLIGTIGGAIGGAFLGRYFSMLGDRAKEISLEVERLVTVTIPLSSWAPKNALTLEYFEWFRSTICENAYMVSNLMGSWLNANKQGLLDATLTPEVRQRLEDSANKAIPALLENLEKKIK